MKRSLILMFLAASLILSGCGPEVVATVNGKKILATDLNRRFEIIKLQNQAGGAELTDEEAGKLKEDILDSLIDETLLIAYAAAENIGATSEEVSSKLDEVKKSFASEGDFLSKLKENGLTLEFLGEEIRKSLIYEKVFPKVTEGFELSEDDFNSAIEEAQTKHILLDDEKTAKEVLDKLKAGGDFAALAGEYSKDQGSAANGGDIGWASRYGLVKEYGDVAFSQDLNVISEPTQSRFGWHIIVTLGKRAPTLSGQEEAALRSEVTEVKKGEEFEEWLKELREEADIKINRKADVELDEESDVESNEKIDNKSNK
ncbi:MAG: peptidylprolyl isomerase [Actinomycetota bacterium]|nr:peptidylprolyl isomerase [Actinomycetota bacterium]